MDSLPRWLSPGLCGLAVLCFLFPFISISCGGQQLATISGLELVTGKSRLSASDEGSLRSSQSNVDPQLFAVLALIGAVGGVAAGLVSAWPRWLKAGLPGAGALFLFLQRQKILNDLQGQAETLVQFKTAFWLALLALLAACIIGVLNQGESASRYDGSVDVSPPRPAGG